MYKLGVIIDFAQNQEPNSVKLFKDAKEIIKYSMPNLSKLRSVDSYSKLCAMASDLCVSIDSTGGDQDLLKIATEFKTLVKRC